MTEAWAMLFCLVSKLSPAQAVKKGRRHAFLARSLQPWSLQAVGSQLEDPALKGKAAWPTPPEPLKGHGGLRVGAITFTWTQPN